MSHMRPTKQLLGHIQCPILPKISSFIINFSLNIFHVVIWYHKPALEHKERSVKVEFCMTLFGKLLVTFQGRIVLLSEVYISQPLRARQSGHQSRKRSRDVRWGISDKVVFAFDMNNGDTGKEVRKKKAAHQSYCPLKLGSEKKYSRGLWLVQTTKLSPAR